jgi:hypothetical protein
MQARQMLKAFQAAPRVGMAANLLVVILTLPFLLVPRTASVRAGGWGLLVLVVAVWALVWGLPQSWRQASGGKFSLGVLGLVLALTPLPLAYWLFHGSWWKQSHRGA